MRFNKQDLYSRDALEDFAKATKRDGTERAAPVYTENGG